MAGIRAWVALAAIGSAACDDAGAGADTRPPPVITGAQEVWPPARPTMHFGRGVEAQPAARADLAGTGPALTAARVIPVAGDGEALAVIEGTTPTGARAIELAEVDGGAVRWRNDRDCAGSVRHADRTGIVCATDAATTAIGLDGAVRWSDPRPTALVDATAVLVIAGDSAVVALDRATGAAGATIALPAGVPAADVRARCGDELWTASADGRVRRLRAVPPAPPRPASTAVAWAVAVGEVRALDACAEIVLVTIAPPAATAVAAPSPPPVRTPSPAPGRRRRGRRAPPPPPAAPDPPDPPVPQPIALVDRTPTIAVVALDRTTGRILGGPVLARGMWPARDGSTELELATAAGIERRPRDLAPGRVLDGSPVVGALLDRRGDHRLVAGPGTADDPARSLYLLDRRGVRAVIAAPAASAALGEHHVIAAATAAPVRLALPADRPRSLPPLPTAAPQPPIARLELATARVVELTTVIAHSAITADAIAEPRIDPLDPAVIWTAVQAAGATVLARLDLRARVWTIIGDGCPSGPEPSVIATTSVIACAAATDAAGGSVRATRRDGTRAWTWTGPAFDTVASAGDTIVLTTGARAVTLDAATGAVGDDRRRDDGLAAVVVPVRIGEADAIVAVERGAIVARAIAAPLGALWATIPRGLITGIALTPADALVVLDGLDPYQLDLGSGRARPLAAAADRWSVAGELVVGETAHDDGWAVRVFDAGGERFRAAVVADPPFAIATSRTPGLPGAPAAPLVIVHGAARQAVILDPATGGLIDHVALPERAAPGTVFTTVVDGQPVAGTLVLGPLAALTF